MNSGDDPDWSGREGKALGMLLGANPRLTADGVTRLLACRERSQVNHSDRPGLWIEYLSSYRRGPIDRFKISQNEGNGKSQPKPKIYSPPV
jgi:hypothetical protein